MTKDEFFTAIGNEDVSKACDCFQFYIDHFPVTVKERKQLGPISFVETDRRTSMRISHFDGTGSPEAQIFTMQSLLKIKSKLEEYFIKTYES